MSIVLENFVQYDLTDEEAATLKRMGLIVEWDDPEATATYALTAFVWDDLGLQGREDVAFDLFDRILGRPCAEA